MAYGSGCKMLLRIAFCCKVPPADLHVLTIQDSIATFSDALDEGWKPTSEFLGAESREYLQMMSWVGRQSATRLVKHLIQAKDCSER